GSGGFADVFLYRQFRPQRRVAIKVLLSNVLDDSVRRLFDAEANVMAQMSTHPSIVTIHQAEVSDDHRPYIVMEYCPRPNYGMRFRKERITVAEALRVGVQIAHAVETAHRAGILHRDIRPANILVTDYNRPALADFGISIAPGQANGVEDSQRMSPLWPQPACFEAPAPGAGWIRTRASRRRWARSPGRAMRRLPQGSAARAAQRSRRRRPCCARPAAPSARPRPRRPSRTPPGPRSRTEPSRGPRPGR